MDFPVIKGALVESVRFLRQLREDRRQKGTRLDLSVDSAVFIHTEKQPLSYT